MSDGTAVSAAVTKNGDAILDARVSAQEDTRTYKFITKEELRAQCSRRSTTARPLNCRRI